MNFLSHYYFDRNNANPYQVLGCLLPDLVKNTDKSWNIFPEKQALALFSTQNNSDILIGWKKHLLVDKIFHASDFFSHHQHQLKLQFTQLLKQSPIKPFFLAHISVELLLDSLLITQKLVDAEQLYQQLNTIDDAQIINFLEINHLPNPVQFYNFYQLFKNEKYLLAYADEGKISYSLKRICMRIWEQPLSQAQETDLSQLLSMYKIKLSQDFIFIFDHIAAKL